MAKIREINCESDKAPSWFDLKESQAWSTGAEYGAKEMLAAITLYLKESGCNNIAGKIIEHCKIKT